MSEKEIIERTGHFPITVQSLARDLTTLGVSPGMVVLVHSSLSSLGWVCGGAVAVIQALEQVLTPEGTLVMPTHSGNLTDPEGWENPPVPQSWWATIRSSMPAFDPDVTPTRAIGVVAECFRNKKDVRRSMHPHYSFAAWGKQANAITYDHSLDFGMGPESPLSRIYRMAGWVLLLGVRHDSNSSLHLAEYWANYSGKVVETNGAPVLVNNKRQWITLSEINLDIDDFEKIGADFSRDTGLVQQGKVGLAQALLMPQRPLVDFATQWLEQHRV